MNTANLELCKELYRLSGWAYEQGSNGWWYDGIMIAWATHIDNSIPAYDLGYLLRKLPPTIKGYDLAMSCGEDWWCFKYEKWIGGGFGDDLANSEADSPENAATKLCIELFKSGVLK